MNRPTLLTRLSNIATKDEIEAQLSVSYQYGNLYRPNPVINGMHESNLSIITSENPKKIQFAIWGILPDDYGDNWKQFQYIENTLATDTATIGSDHWLLEAWNSRRCLILVTGYFTVLLHNKKLHPFHVRNTKKEVFALAGIYNKLNDGFISCTILMQPASKKEIKTKSFSMLSPVIIPQENRAAWLNTDIDSEKVMKSIQYSSEKFTTYAVSNELFRKGKKTNAVLNPVMYPIF